MFTPSKILLFCFFIEAAFFHNVMSMEWSGAVKKGNEIAAIHDNIREREATGPNPRTQADSNFKRGSVVMASEHNLKSSADAEERRIKKLKELKKNCKSKSESLREDEGEEDEEHGTQRSWYKTASKYYEQALVCHDYAVNDETTISPELIDLWKSLSKQYETYGGYKEKAAELCLDKRPEANRQHNLALNGADDPATKKKGLKSAFEYLQKASDPHTDLEASRFWREAAEERIAALQAVIDDEENLIASVVDASSENEERQRELILFPHQHDIDLHHKRADYLEEAAKAAQGKEEGWKQRVEEFEKMAKEADDTLRALKAEFSDLLVAEETAQEIPLAEQAYQKMHEALKAREEALARGDQDAADLLKKRAAALGGTKENPGVGYAYVQADKNKRNGNKNAERVWILAAHAYEDQEKAVFAKDEMMAKYYEKLALLLGGTDQQQGAGVCYEQAIASRLEAQTKELGVWYQYAEVKQYQAYLLQLLLEVADVEKKYSEQVLQYQRSSLSSLWEMREVLYKIRKEQFQNLTVSADPGKKKEILELMGEKIGCRQLEEAAEVQREQIINLETEDLEKQKVLRMERISYLQQEIDENEKNASSQNSLFQFFKKNEDSKNSKKKYLFAFEDQQLLEKAPEFSTILLKNVVALLQEAQKKEDQKKVEAAGKLDKLANVLSDAVRQWKFCDDTYRTLLQEGEETREEKFNKKADLSFAAHIAITLDGEAAAIKKSIEAADQAEQFEQEGNNKEATWKYNIAAKYQQLGNLCQESREAFVREDITEIEEKLKNRSVDSIQQAASDLESRSYQIIGGRERSEMEKEKYRTTATLWRKIAENIKYADHWEKGVEEWYRFTAQEDENDFLIKHLQERVSNDIQRDRKNSANNEAMLKFAIAHTTQKIITALEEHHEVVKKKEEVAHDQQMEIAAAWLDVEQSLEKEIAQWESAKEHYINRDRVSGDNWGNNSKGDEGAALCTRKAIEVLKKRVPIIMKLQEEKKEVQQRDHIIFYLETIAQHYQEAADCYLEGSEAYSIGSSHIGKNLAGVNGAGIAAEHAAELLKAQLTFAEEQSKRNSWATPEERGALKQALQFGQEAANQFMIVTRLSRDCKKEFMPEPLFLTISFPIQQGCSLLVDRFFLIKNWKYRKFFIRDKRKRNEAEDLFHKMQGDYQKAAEQYQKSIQAFLNKDHPKGKSYETIGDHFGHTAYEWKSYLNNFIKMEFCKDYRNAHRVDRACHFVTSRFRNEPPFYAQHWINFYEEQIGTSFKTPEAVLASIKEGIVRLTTLYEQEHDALLHEKESNEIFKQQIDRLSSSLVDKSLLLGFLIEKDIGVKIKENFLED